MRVVVCVSSEGVVSVVIITIAQEQPDIVPDASRDADGYAVLLGSSAVGHAIGRVVVVVVRAKIGIAQVQVRFVVNNERGGEVDYPIVVLCIENGLGIIRRWRRSSTRRSAPA